MHRMGYCGGARSNRASESDGGVYDDGFRWTASTSFLIIHDGGSTRQGPSSRLLDYQTEGNGTLLDVCMVTPAADAVRCRLVAHGPNSKPQVSFFFSASAPLTSLGKQCNLNQLPRQHGRRCWPGFGPDDASAKHFCGILGCDAHAGHFTSR